MTFGQRLKHFRKNIGYTQSALAEAIGVTTQAVSKWETDSGMPDISQIIPLTKVLDISADSLLGIGNKAEQSEVLLLKEKIGKHTVTICADEARRIYDLARPVFAKFPTNSYSALQCLESLAVLIDKRIIENDKASLVKECLRYESCISKYETNSDLIFKSYYILSKCYRNLDEEERADKIMSKIPEVFGDKSYWEAEFSFSEGNMKEALMKCKESFAVKARYISRCIRLARMISENCDGAEGLETQLELNEYMLRIIDAFLSGGNYLPYRMMYQKISLLSLMICQYSELGMKEKASEHLTSLFNSADNFQEFLVDKESTHCLMFPENDMDGMPNITQEKLNNYLKVAETEYRKHFNN